MEELVIDCSELESACRYCSDEAREVLVNKIAGRFAGLHLLGSGDYHYLTKLITDSIQEPFDLLLFDHHPDMQPPAFGGVLSCGGWLRDMLSENKFLRRVTIVGIAAELKSETEGFGPRVSVFCEGDTVLPDDGLCPTCRAVPVVSDHGAGDVPLYVSVDKDVFCTCAARTNWDQGSMTLPQFEAIYTMLAGGRRLLGADICGDLSPSQGATPADKALNEQTDDFIKNILFK